jgi:CubicO group peptidase (beta-lactamase class C family)
MPSWIKQTILILAVLSGGIFLQTASAQQGPPPPVTRAVDAVLALLGSQDDDAIQTFILTAMIPTANADRTGLAQSLRHLREDVRGSLGDVSVEAEPDGVRLILGTGTKQKQLRVVLATAGIADLVLLGSSPQTPVRGRDAAIRGHMRALEAAAASGLDDLVSDFAGNRFTDSFMAETTSQERRALLAAVAHAAGQAGDTQVSERNGDIVLELAGDETIEVQFRVAAEAPYKIVALRVVTKDQGRPEIVLTRDNLKKKFSELAEAGFSGVVHVRLDGSVLLEDAYGTANVDPGIPMQLNTIFGIGSTPIDFTIISIYLLAQEGQLALADGISRYFPDVPADKSAMTIQHLLSGQSGLPDFHDTEDDWNPDLAWIDRQTAETRILNLPLRFAPGTGNEHSHAAFVLLAALIERVSRQDYSSFIRQHFLEPAGMARTGMNGETNGFRVSDFAAGGGPSNVGLPNIPPNWGPTSWLVMGSGGMYSTLGDMLRFYEFIRTSGVLKPEYAARYNGAGVGVGGSDRGFFIFHAYQGSQREAMLITNLDGRRENIRDITRALERLVESR